MEKIIEIESEKEQDRKSIENIKPKANLIKAKLKLESPLILKSLSSRYKRNIQS